MEDEVEDILAELDGYDKVTLETGTQATGRQDPSFSLQARGSRSALQTALQQVRDGASSLDLSHWSIRLGVDGSTALAESLRRPQLKLSTILLNCNDVGSKGATALSEALKVNTTVTKLDLSSNAIGDSGVISFATALKSNISLKILDLEDNGIGPTGATALADALKVNRCLGSLHLAENSCADAGATALAECLLSNSTLQTLWLSGNKIGYPGGLSLSSSLSKNSTLKTLYLGTPRVGSSIYAWVSAKT